MGKVNDNYVKSLFLKDSCDGSGLNTSENSKDSHPLGIGFFWSDIVQLSYTHFLDGTEPFYLTSPRQPK